MAHAKHDYHIVDPSPWPLVTSIFAFLFAIGTVLSLHDGYSYAMGAAIVGIIGLIFSVASWWIDVVKEAEHKGFHKPVVQLHHRYGMVLFIASEVMFFVAWFWAFFDAAVFADAANQVLRTTFTGGIWPPKGTHVFDAWSLPLLNTLILLLSGTSLTWAHHALIQNDRKGFLNGLAITIILGLIFTSLQVVEYMEAPFSFKESIYGATFFMATGFHGFHVIVGTIFLIVCYIRGLNGHFKPDHHFGFEAAAWYWHFVDVVWLFLFASIYVWGNYGGTIAVH